MGPIWISILSAPPLHLYRDAAALQYIPAGERAAQVLVAVGDLQAELDGITPSVSAALDNGAGECTDLLHARPPVRVPARLYRGAELLFAGLVQRVTLGAEAAIEVQA